MEEAPIHNVDEQLLATDPDHPKRAKKRQKQPQQWARNVKKEARLQGRELNDQAGNVIVKGRRMRDMDCICSCSAKLTQDEKEFVFEQFRSKKSHSVQNEYLRGCTLVTGVNFFESGKMRRGFRHVLRFNMKTVEVCQKYFLGIHGIDRSRLRTQVLNQEVDIDDKRGKHSNHHVVTTEEVKNKIRIFLSSLPARSSHYSLHDNPDRRYMDSDLTVTSLFSAFFEHFPEVQAEQAKLPVFRQIFNYEFNIKFGEPRTDKCSTCEKNVTALKNEKIQNVPNNDVIHQLNQVQVTHLQSAQIFYDDYEKISDLPNDHFAICFDYQKNFPLPSTQVNKEYFISQLWVCNFGIKDMRSRKTTMFLNSEHFAHKGANEVITCLLWYINSVVPAEMKTLHVFCDNTFGQNKNRFVLAALQYLANVRFEAVYLTFPVPGHSRMPIDADFGRIAIKAKSFETYSYPSEITYFIRQAQRENPFDVVYVNSNFTDDLCDDGTPVLNVKNFKLSLANSLLSTQQANLHLRSAREFLFRRDRDITINHSGRFEHPPRDLKLFVNGFNMETLKMNIEEASSAYDDFLPISDVKLKNVEELTNYVVAKPNLLFYDTLYSLIGDTRRYYNE